MILGKSLSTPHALVEGIVQCIEKTGIAFADVNLFLHGSTIAINTLLERTGARTALLVTALSFRDIYEIGRVNRPDAYNLFFGKHKPLVERALRFEVHERLLADGSVRVPLDEAEIRALAKQLSSLGVEAVKESFLSTLIASPAHGNTWYATSCVRPCRKRSSPRPANCRANIANLSECRRLRLQCLHIGPRVRSYIDEIEHHLRDAGFRGSFASSWCSRRAVCSMPTRQSNTASACWNPGPLPASLVRRRSSRTLGLDTSIIAFDMGGTTRQGGRHPQRRAARPGQRPCRGL